MDYLTFIRDRIDNQPESNYHKHHIIPRCLGGADTEDNLVKLSYEDHGMAHKLLYEENKDNKSLELAGRTMASMTQDEYADSRYGAAKGYYKNRVTQQYERVRR